MKEKKIQLRLFSEPALLILISLVTLLLQLISFATTWSGSMVYLEGVFPFASLLFAIAIQTTAYFLSNSLRTKVGILKMAALCAALCCSTYYSYIGIYNSVNSPVSYLQKNYIRITEDLTRLFEKNLQENISQAEDAVGEAASLIASHYAALTGELENSSACVDALASLQGSYTDGMRAPRQSAYENYEDYVAAYSAYIAGMSAGNNTENDALRKQTLASYGFDSQNALNETQLSVNASLLALHSALSVSADKSAEDFLQALSELKAQLSLSIENTALGVSLKDTDTARLTRLLQAAKLCGYDGLAAADILNACNRCAQATVSPLLNNYSALVSSLPEARVTAANTMELKTSMDSEILAALLTANSLLPEDEALSFTDERFLLTDLYLIPIRSLTDSSTRLTALFCLTVAALIDFLSVLFAVSLRKRTPLYKRRSLLGSGFADYETQIFATLPAGCEPDSALSDFLQAFRPSPETEADGYMMQTDLNGLSAYYPLVALLCQLNLARIVPAAYPEGVSASLQETSLSTETTTAEVLLLKARFVFWANELIYHTRTKERTVFA